MGFAHLGFLFLLLGAVIVLPGDSELWSVMSSLCVCITVKEEIFILGYSRQWLHGHSIQHTYSWKERYTCLFLLLCDMLCPIPCAQARICELKGGLM